MEKINAQYGYTLDGEKRGHLENETFSADGFVVKIQGISQHPGFAKGRMESALKIAAEIVNTLPKDRLSPETTEGKEGFIHPTAIYGSVEEATIEFIIRDFDTEKLREYGFIIQQISEMVLRKYPNSSATYTTSIRGTDGSRLTFMGLPCPNIFAGEHAFHSKQEWVSVQDMQKATETVLYLVSLFVERSK
jgi:tripeptide aminopeptidase